VIGVCTTCLAETIGEDAAAIVKKFREQNPDSKAKIINVSAPGYGGTQNEGWFTACRSILEQTEPNRTPNGKVNIIIPQISPADTRWLKSFLKETNIDYILLPDISDSLDGVADKNYSRLKTDGTSLQSVAEMAGAKLTLEFSEFIDDKYSPAAFLKEKHGVPYIKLPLPAGVRGMDKLISALAEIGGVIGEETKKARSRYLDAMIDSHKKVADFYTQQRPAKFHARHSHIHRLNPDSQDLRIYRIVA
jgi:nitrogenase molybdenum-iron protein alpha/beta subunit